MSLLTTVQEATPGNYYFLLDGQTTGTLPSGYVAGATWTAGPSGTYYTAVTVPGASTSSIFLVTPSSFANDITDALACTIVTAFGSTLGGGQLIIYVAGNPANTANFYINWACIKL